MSVTKLAIKPENLLSELAEEIRDANVETGFSIREAVIRWYHAVGSAILQKHALISRSEHLPMEKLIRILSPMVKKSDRTLYFSIAFAKKYPSLDDLPNEYKGKNASFSMIKASLYKDVPAFEKAEREEKTYYCPKCGHFGARSEFSGKEKLKERA